MLVTCSLPNPAYGFLVEVRYLVFIETRHGFLVEVSYLVLAKTAYGFL